MTMGPPVLQPYAHRRRLHGVLQAFWRDSQYPHDGAVMAGVSQLLAAKPPIEEPGT